jgi:hypothetical protein
MPHVLITTLSATDFESCSPSFLFSRHGLRCRVARAVVSIARAAAPNACESADQCVSARKRIGDVLIKNVM